LGIRLVINFTRAPSRASRSVGRREDMALSLGLRVTAELKISYSRFEVCDELISSQIKPMGAGGFIPAHSRR